MASRSRARRSQVTNYWPGFVDALSSLLLVIIFLLSLFMLTQFFLGQEIQGKDTAMSRLNSQIAELTELLNLERTSNEDATSDLAALQATLGTMTAERVTLAAQLAGADGVDAADPLTVLELAQRHPGEVHLGLGRRRGRGIGIGRRLGRGLGLHHARGALG